MWTVPFMFDVQKTFSECKDEGYGQTLVPAVDVYENSREFTVVARMPGVDPAKVSVNVENDILRIEGEIDIGRSDGDEIVFQENQASRYSRAFRIGRSLDSSQIEAQLKHGLLKVKIPKLEVARPRKVEVTVH